MLFRSGDVQVSAAHVLTLAGDDHHDDSSVKDNAVAISAAGDVLDSSVRNPSVTLHPALRKDQGQPTSSLSVRFDESVQNSTKHHAHHTWQKIGSSMLVDAADRDLVKFCIGDSVCFRSDPKEYIGSIVDTASSDRIGLQVKVVVYGFPRQQPTTVFKDNAACIFLSKRSGQINRAKHKHKHINTRVFRLRELVRSGVLELSKVSTKDQVANLFTKAQIGRAHV